MRTLLVGEGDFSYAVQFSEKNTNFVASCLADVNPHSPETVNNIQLLKNRGVIVRTDVDARKLDNLNEEILKGGLFTRIIFNFPHVGGKMHIGRNRQLLKDFFHASCNVLDKRNGSIQVALCVGQGGTRMDKRRRYEDTWKIEEMASEAAFALVHVEPFEATYTNIGYRSLNKRFNTEGALIHLFQYSGCPPSLCDRHFHGTENYQNEQSENDEDSVHEDDKHKSNGTTAVTMSESPTNAKQCLHIERDMKFHLSYDIHFSFWTLDIERFDFEKFCEQFDRCWPELNIKVEGPIDVFKKDNRISRCFHLNISSCKFALSKQLVVTRFVEMLRENLVLWLPSAETRS